MYNNGTGVCLCHIYHNQMKFRLAFLSIFFSIAHFCFGIEDAFKNVSSILDANYTLSLNGEWKFKFINSSDWSSDKEFFMPNYDDKAWGMIPIPGCWDALGYVSPRYVGPNHDMNGLYRTTFTIPNRWKDKHVFVKFDGILRGYELWINGKYVGKWESAYNTCQFDITPYIKSGANLLALRNYVMFKGFDFDANDDWGQVGINRSVTLFAVPNNHLKDLSITTTDVDNNSAKVSINIDLSSFHHSSYNGSDIFLRITNPKGETIYQKKTRTHNSNIKDSIIVEKPSLWTAETPFLYNLELQVGKSHNIKTKFGIREVTIKKNVLFLNGRKFKLRGINLHETDPFTGKYVSDSVTLRDLKMMKEANINFIRCSHYPRNPSFYDMCDSLGFYVINEVPFGFGDDHLYDKTYQDILLTRADATVRRDKNHPCILFWSIGNENPLTPISEETGRFVKKLDPTRPICYPMVHNYFLSLDFNLPEFIDIFAPHYPTVATLRYYAEAAERPVLLTEYCHSLGQSLEQHDELWSIIEQNDNLAGGAVWEWVDQGMVDKNAKYPGDYGVNENLWLKDSTCITMAGNSGTDGILYANRVPLSNYYELRNNYSQAKIKSKVLYGEKGWNSFDIIIQNKFDFINLNEAVSFRWELMDICKSLECGDFQVDCIPGKEITKTFNIHLPNGPEESLYYVNISVYNNHGNVIGKYSLPIRSHQNQALMPIFGLTHQKAVSVNENSINKVIAGYFDERILLRAGRKHGLSEQLKASNSIKHYLIVPKCGKTYRNERIIKKEIVYENEEFQSEGTISYEQLNGDAIKISLKQIPKASKKLLLEGGFSFILDSRFENITWIGAGPYSSYPGKNNANTYGCYNLSKGDLYFEGNRTGVDAVIVMDKEKDGFIMIPEDHHVNFEQTDKGIVLSVNKYISGLCGKLRKTEFPVYLNEIDEISTSITIIPLSSMKWIKELLPTAKPYNPFLTLYDTYLLELDKIIGKDFIR